MGGLSRARKANYLRARGWQEEAPGRWTHPIFGPQPLARALHHQLTDDLSQALVRLGWQVEGFTARGYVQLRDGVRGGRPCSLPKALRTQARRERQPVADFTYALFLAALLDAEG